MSSKCERYLSEREYASQVIDGTIVRGTLYVNSKKPMDAFLKPFGPYMKSGFSEDSLIDDLEISEADIVVIGPVNRNRAIHGDIVGVRLKSKKETEEDAIRYAFSDIGILNTREFGQVKYVEKHEGRGRWQTYYAVLRSNRPVPVNNELTAKFKESEADFRPDLYVDWRTDMAIKAVPIDRRIPWLRIELAHLQWLARREKTEGPWSSLLNSKELPEFGVFEVKIIDWKEHQSLPAGNLVAYLGFLGVPSVEETIGLQSAKLLDHRDPFSMEVEEFVTRQVNETQNALDSITQSRVDFTKERIFTIDPTTARDLDDAISVKRMTGYVQIFVHIADVSHFVRANNALDEVASSRTTTVYLPHKAYHMLPRTLCEQACSLNPEGKKLAFSCSFCVNYNGELLEEPAPKFFKSVVQSKYQLSYDQAQQLLNTYGAKRELQHKHFTPIYLVDEIDEAIHPISDHPEYPLEELIKDLVLLEDLTQKMRETRFKAGMLTLNKVQLRFHCYPKDAFDSDTDLAGLPQSLYVDRHTSSHELIEELMLMTNTLAAKTLVQSPLYQLAVCRYHPPLDVKKIERVKVNLKKLGVEANLESSGDVQKTMDWAYINLGQRVGMTAEQILIQALQLAKYDAYGGKDFPGPHHYGLSCDAYTHFTSPIRRYPDILVHRLMDIILRLEAQNYTADVDLNDPETVTEPVEEALVEFGYSTVEALSAVCNRCNEKKECSKKAQEKTGISWLLMYLNRLPYPKGTLVTVVSVDDKSLEVFVNEMGLVRRIEYQNRGSERLNLKMRKVYKHIVDVPLEYIKQEKHCVIGWGGDRFIRVGDASAIAAWILPTQDVPLDFLIIPIPPDHTEFKILHEADRRATLRRSA